MIEREKVMYGLYACSEDYGVPDICGLMNCPYKDHPVECVHLLARDAYNLLSKMEPRVLTLEEVQSDHEHVYWIECGDSITQHYGQYRGRCWCHQKEIGPWEQFDCIEPSDQYLRRRADKYGKEWRCWSSKPTEQARQDTPWGEWGG